MLRVSDFNFVTSPSGLLVPAVTANPTLGNGAADVTFDIVAATSDGYVLTSEAGEAVWLPPAGGSVGVDSVAVEGETQLTGDVTFSEGTDITLTQVGNDIEIANSGASGIPATIFDAKGDLIAASAADTAARLGPIGANGTILTADSAESTGMKWAAPAGSSSAWTLLHTLTRATDGTFDQASISGAYNDLIVVAIVRGTETASQSNINIQVNNDGGSNYGTQIENASNATVAASQANSSVAGIMGLCPSATASSGWFAMLEIIISGYASTTWRKIIRSQTSYSEGIASGNRSVRQHLVAWNSTAAITRIALFPSANDFLTGSTMRIYGRL